MYPLRRTVATILLAALPSAGLANAPARAPETDREKALHALNRLGFGPRPGDVDRVVKMGVSGWIESQLKPDSIPDPAIPGRLAGLPTLSMSSREIFDTFELPLRAARREKRAAATAAAGPASAASDSSLDPDMKDRIPPARRPRRLIEELSAARVVRAAWSERQTNEVLVDFWMNHFNVFAAKGLDRVLVTSFERDVVRPRIWGRFDDLLLATAKSPAMLFYLDNARSVADPEHRPQPRRGGFGGFGRARMSSMPGVDAAQRKGGLNENYARELMELHTLGVDGGYTQKDVTELARLLTGWSIDPADGTYFFRARAHDTGAKTVLGRTFRAGGGEEEGEAMIRLLARQPATARHISLELCRRLVSDSPPAALVDRVAAKFLGTGGDLRQTVRAIVESPEFFDPQYYRAKVKSPFEYVVSAIRAAGGETTGGVALLKQIAQMGEPLYLCQPPTGYSDDASAWVNTGALVARLNFALALAGNRIPGAEVDLPRLLSAGDASDPKKSVDTLARVLVGGELSRETRDTIERRLSAPPEGGEGEGEGNSPAPPSRLSLIAGLLLGSPEFQRQ